jgi:hypothetical protein
MLLDARDSSCRRVGAVYGSGGRAVSRSSWFGALQLTPVTFDVAEAREWYDVLPGAMGVGAC